jgi:hypothetical protein
MSLLLKAGELHPFTPHGSERTYLLRVPSTREAHLIDQKAVGRRGRRWHQLDLAKLLRDEFRKMVAADADPEACAPLVELVEGWVGGMQSAMDAWVEAGDSDELRQAYLDAAKPPGGMVEIENLVREASDAYCAAIAQQEAWPHLYGIAAAELFLDGWEGEELPPFKRGLRGVPDDLLNLIPDRHFVEIGQEMARILSPDETARKNSRSASSGASSRPSSTGSTEVRTRRLNGHSNPTGGTVQPSAAAGSESTHVTS